MTTGRKWWLDSFTCPVCGSASFDPDDIAEGYCGACHDWTGSLASLGPPDAE